MISNRQFISRLARNSGMTTAEAEAILQQFVKIIIQSTANGKPVCLQNFGTFDIKQKKEKRLFSPNTKQMQIIPASTTIAFRQSTALRSKLTSEEGKEDEA